MFEVAAGRASAAGREGPASVPGHSLQPCPPGAHKPGQEAHSSHIWHQYSISGSKLVFWYVWWI